jgi:hypothetical protein
MNHTKCGRTLFCNILALSCRLSLRKVPSIAAHRKNGPYVWQQRFADLMVRLWHAIGVNSPGRRCGLLAAAAHGSLRSMHGNPPIQVRALY